jgi:hypothetical protein
MSIVDFQEAARHTASCSMLADFIVPFRGNGKGSKMGLFEATAVAVAAALTDRTNPAFRGFFHQRDAWLSVQSRMVAIIETAAREARTQGRGTLARALDFAASDIANDGELSPAVAALLAQESAI